MVKWTRYCDEPPTESGLYLVQAFSSPLFKVNEQVIPSFLEIGQLKYYVAGDVPNDILDYNYEGAGFYEEVYNPFGSYAVRVDDGYIYAYSKVELQDYKAIPPYVLNKIYNKFYPMKDDTFEGDTNAS